MDRFIYFLKANVKLTIFTLLFVFLFRKETWFHLNRFYFLFAVIAALLIPVLRISLQPVQPVKIPLNDYSIPEFFDDSFQYLAADETVHSNSEWLIFSFLEMVYFCV